MGPVQRLSLSNGLRERFWYVAEPLLNGGNVCWVRSTMAHGSPVCDEIPNDLALLFEREPRKAVLEHDVARRGTTSPGVRLNVVRVPREEVEDLRPGEAARLSVHCIQTTLNPERECCVPHGVPEAHRSPLMTPTTG